MPTETVYQASNGDWIVRREEIGHEGADICEPCLITWWSCTRAPLIGDDLRFVGIWSRVKPGQDARGYGPMFEKAA